MSPLAELQASFADYLLAPPDVAVPASLIAALARDGTGAEAERIAVYKNNVHSRLVDALAETFPVVVRLVGEEFFRYAAQTYVARRAPRSPVLAGYGDQFPAFLSRFAPATSVPYLPDVARLEMHYVEAYHAAERKPLGAAAIVAALARPDSNAPIALHPSARLMTSRFPVSKIWELNRQTDFPAGTTQIPGNAEQLLVIRPAATVEVRRVGRGAHAALRALAERATVADALAAGLRVEPDVDLRQQLAALAAGASFVQREP